MESQLSRLKSEADISQVIASLGLQTFRKGQNNFIYCPNPDHTDKHPDNCYYQNGWNNVYCTACGRSYKAIDIICWTMGLDPTSKEDVGTAGKYLWELEGCPDWYSGGEKEKSFYLSSEEYKVIGMKPSGTVLIPFACSSEKEVLERDERYEMRETGYYLKQKEVRVSWKDFMDESGFKRLVASKAKDAVRYYREAEEKYGITSSYRETAEKVYKKAVQASA